MNDAPPYSVLIAPSLHSSHRLLSIVRYQAMGKSGTQSGGERGMEDKIYVYRMKCQFSKAYIHTNRMGLLRLPSPVRGQRRHPAHRSATLRTDRTACVTETAEAVLPPQEYLR